jgi:enoyl-CoA hydratase
LIWPALIGPNRAKRYLLTGEHLDASTALELGLVNEVVPPDRVLARATEMAAELARGPRHAIAWTKQAVNVALLREATWMMVMTNAQEARTMGQADILEGIAAFQEGRQPRWPSANGTATVNT